MSSQSSGVEKGGGGGSSSEIVHGEPTTTTIQHQPIDLAAHRGPAVVQLRPIRSFSGISQGTLTTTGKTTAGVFGGNTGLGAMTGNITATPTGTPSSIISVNNRTGPNLTILPARGVGQPIVGSGSNTGNSIGTASSTTTTTGQIPTYQIARGTIVGNVRSNLTTGHQGSITVTPISTSNFSNIRLTGPVNNGTWIQSGGNPPEFRTATITVSGRTVRPDGKMIHIPQSGSVQHVTQLQMVDNKGSILKPQLTATPLRAGTAGNPGTPLTLAPFTIRATNINLPTIQRPLGSSPNTTNQVQKVITSPAHGPPIQLLSTQKLPHAIQTITPIPRITCLTLSTHGNVAPNNTAPVVSSKQGATSLIMTPSVSTGSTTSSLPFTKVYPVSRDGLETLFATSQQQQQAVSSSNISSTIPLSTSGGGSVGGPISHQPTTTLNVNPISFTAVTGGQTQLPNVVIAASSTSNSTNTSHLISNSGGGVGQTTSSGNNTPLSHGHHLVQVHGPITVNSVINQSSNSSNSSSSGPTISISTPGTMTQSYFHVDSKNLHHHHHQQQQQQQHGRPITIEKRTIITGAGGVNSNTIGENLISSSNKNLLPGSTVILTTTSAQPQATSNTTTGHILHTVQNPNNTSIVIPTTTTMSTTNPNHITISHNTTGPTAFSNTISNLSTLQTHSILTPITTTTTTTSSIGSVSSSINFTHHQQQQHSAIPAHVISSQNFGGITSNSSNSNILHHGSSSSSSNVIPNVNTSTTTSSPFSSVIVTSSSSSSNTIISGNTFQSSSSNSDIRSSSANNNNNNNNNLSSLVTPNTVNNTSIITTNTNSNNAAATSSSNSMTSSTGTTTTTTTTMQTSTPAQSPSSQNQTKSTLSPRPSILRKREAAADHHHNLSLPLRAQRNLALNFAISSSSGHSTASSASSLVNSTTTSTSTTTASSSSNIITSSTVNNNNSSTQNNNNSSSSTSGNITTINTNSTRDSGNIHITGISSSSINNSGITFSNLSNVSITSCSSSSNNNNNIPIVSLVTSNHQQQSLNQCKDSSSSMAQISSSSLTQQTLVPGSSILKKEFLPPNEESSWQSCSSNSSGSTTISTTSETAEIQMQQSQQQQHTMLSSNGNHHHGLLPTVTVTGLNELSGSGSLSYGSLISGGPINNNSGSSSTISQNGIIRSANNSLRPKALNKNNAKDSAERMKGRQDKDDGVSPRKKPRKQQLPTSDLFDSASPEISFYQGKRFKKSELIDPKMFEDFHERLNEELPAANEEPQISYYIKKPQMSLIQSNKYTSKPPHNHFQRYCDVKSKDERRPTVNDLLNQKNVIQKANGWKLQHLNNQVEEVIELEGDVVDRFSELLSKLEVKIGSSCTDRDLNRIMELLKGNIQRGKVIRDQMLESKSQVLKILEHKPRILDVINKYNSKRPIKKREKF